MAGKQRPIDLRDYETLCIRNGNVFISSEEYCKLHNITDEELRTMCIENKLVYVFQKGVEFNIDAPTYNEVKDLP